MGKETRFTSILIEWERFLLNVLREGWTVDAWGAQCRHGWPMAVTGKGG